MGEVSTIGLDIVKSIFQIPPPFILAFTVSAILSVSSAFGDCTARNDSGSTCSCSSNNCAVGSQCYCTNGTGANSPTCDAGAANLC
jgi:hypothetical protein